MGSASGDKSPVVLQCMPLGQLHNEEAGTSVLECCGKHLSSLNGCFR